MDKTIEEVLEEYKNIVLAKAGKYKLLGGEKEDLIQEGMIGLVKAYNNFDPSRGADFKTFADRCITHQLISAVKAAARQKNGPLNDAISLDSPVSEDDSSLTWAEILLADSETSPEDQLLYLELTELLTCPPKAFFSSMEQEVLSLLIKGQNYKEIAEKLQKTPKQTDNAIQRIKQKIKTLI